MYNFPFMTLILPETNFTIIFNYIPRGFRYILLFIYSWEVKGSLTFLVYTQHSVHCCCDVDIIYYHYHLPSSIKALWPHQRAGGVGVAIPLTVHGIYSTFSLRGPLRALRAPRCVSVHVSFTILSCPPPLNFGCSQRHTWESFKMSNPTVSNT